MKLYHYAPLKNTVLSDTGEIAALFFDILNSTLCIINNNENNIIIIKPELKL